MSENELKACPLCGRTDVRAGVEFIPRGRGRGINVGIVECLTPGCPMIIRATTEEEAIIAWNRRPIEEQLEKEKIELLNSVIYAFEQFSYMRYAEANMDTSIEKDNVMDRLAKEGLERLREYRR